MYNNLNNNKKMKPIDLLFQKEKSNLSNNNRSLIFDENNVEYKFSNSGNNYNLLNYKESGYPHMNKTKMINDNTITKINLNNNKSNLMKRGGFNDDINNMYSYNYNNKLATRNLGFINASKKQSKLIFDQNKNIGLFNNYNMNKEKEKKINYKNKNKPFDIKETSGNKNHGNVKSCGKNKNSSSAEPKNTTVSRSQKNINDDNNTYLNYTRNLTNNNMINKNRYISIKENMNKSTDELPFLNKNNMNQNNLNNTQKDTSNINNDNINLKFNSTISGNILKNSNSQNDITTKKKITFSKDKNIHNKPDERKSTKTNKNNINDDNKNINDQLILKSLTVREKAYYALSQSMVLDLRDRIFFSRMTEKLRSLTSVKEIQKANDSYVKNKIKELEQKILDYNTAINTPFIPSKIAMISINLIMENDEDDFINFIKNNGHIEEKEKDYYNVYVGLLFILLKENYDENNKEENNINSLCDKLDKKGYENFKDYLYENFISHKNGRQIYNESRINKFNELFEKLPDLVKYQGEIKNCKFISFSYFLIHELYIYWDKIKELHDIKTKAQSNIKFLKSKIVNTSK